MRTEHWFVWSASCPNNPRSVFARLLSQTLQIMMCTETGPRKTELPAAALYASHVQCRYRCWLMKTRQWYLRSSYPLPLSPCGVGCSTRWTSLLRHALQTSSTESVFVVLISPFLLCLTTCHCHQGSAVAERRPSHAIFVPKSNASIGIACGVFHPLDR